MSNLNLNKVVLVGRLTADPELKFTPTGVSVVSGSIAVNRPARVVNNERVVEADFINFVAWRKTAEFISKYFKKGSAICVTGSMQSRTWEDNNSVKRYITEVVINEVMFVDSLSNNKAAATSEGTYVPEVYGAPTFTSGADIPNFEEVQTDDDLPF